MSGHVFVFGLSIVPFSTILLLDFGAFSDSVIYFISHCIKKIFKILKG